MNDHIEIKGCRNRDLWFVLDVSGSMEGKPLDDVRSSTLDIFGSIVKAKDRVEVCTFGSSVAHPLPLERKDAKRFRSCMNGLQINGCTALWDAIVTTIDRVAEQKSNQHKRFAEVVVLTDGNDNYSRHSFEDARAKVARPGCVLKLFVIAVGEGVSQTTRNQLRQLCEPINAKLFLESSVSGIIQAFGKVKRELVRTIETVRTVKRHTRRTQRIKL